MAPKPAEKAPSSQAQNPAAYGYTRKGLSGQDATNSSASAATPGGKASTSTNFKDSAGQGSQNAPGRLITDRSDGRSLREKFNVDTRTGGVSFSVPIQTSPGRSGFGPSLSLAYDSGSASSNGVFGLGWHLSGVDSIARKTSVMIPVYDNDQDTFVHSRVGDLVPVMQPGSDEPVEWDEKLGTSNYRVRIYRPRVESDPVRVERWSSLDSSGKMHWKTVESGNKTTIFGQDTGSQISSNHGTAGEGGLELVFSWLVNEVYDSQGNHMVFSYKTESQPALTASIADKVYENNRNATSQRYLKRIKYGNKKPNRDLKDWGVLNASPQDDQWYWMFEVVFDYGEHPGEYPTTQEDPTGWALRPDPFSVHTSGFEIRTYRLCQRVLMFHRFEELKRQDYLIAAAEFKYETDAKSGESVLRSCIQCGYQLNGENLSCVRLPASEFEYWTSPDVGDISVEEFELDLSGLSTPGVQWVDLHGDGAPGVLARVPGRGWYYHGNESGDTPAFGAATLVSQIPSVVDSDDWSFEDLTGNGKLDVAYANPEGHVWGFYERQDDGEWSSFAPFESYPTAYFNSDPAFHKVDLNGDGHADILQLLPQQNDEFGWYPSLGRKGYSAGKRTSGAPPLPLGEGKLLILCDMDGDGLSDIVLIYNSHICYWPNMGHGRFGQKVIMANPPFLADNTSFSPLRIRMADITGSGTADLIYLPPEGGVLVYYNQSGNVWSDAHVLPTFPPLDQLCAVDLFDIGGRGTQCLCWTSDHLSRSTGSTTVRYIDLMGGRKPGLMTKCSNGVGGEVEMTYRSSTHYHQEDKRAGRPWATKLPFPIHCVEQVVTKDVVAQTACTTRYFYHDGYYDHVERQFRGFQMVETWDAEDFSSVSTKKFHRPPVHTKTWFYLGLQRIDEATVLPGCYQINQPQQSPLPSAKIHAKVSAQQLAVEDIKDAFRALAGQQRRQEVFSDDGSLKSVVPYLVSQQTFEVVMHQAVLQGQRYGIFRVNRREELTSHYERELDEATVQHSFILQTDDYGNVCSQVAINYGKPDSKLEKDEDRQKQQEAIIFYTETDHTNAFDPLASPDSTQVGYFQAPLPSEVRQYRVFPGSSWICNSPARYDWETLAASISEIKEVSIHGDPPTGSSERGYSILLSKTRTLYSKTDLTGPLPANKLEQFSIEYQSYRLALTKELLETTLKDGEAPLLDSKALSKELSEGGYMQLDNRTDEWWAPFTRKLFKDDISDDNPYSSLAAARSYFYLSNAEIDQFNNVSHQELDKYRLLTEKSIDAVKNETLFENDYVHLQATLITDANGNRTQTVFDPCGRPVGAAVMGKTTEALGDSLDGFSVELSQDQLDQFIENPSGPIAAQLLGNAGRRAIYHDRFGRDTNQKPEKIIPAFHAELVRDTHYKDDSGKAVSSQIAVHIIYLDGHGEAIQEVSLSGNSGDANAWQFSGWVIRDNKRQPVQEFHPFKALTHDFHSQVDSSSVPATTLLRDPLDRVVAVLNANHTWSKIRFTPWIQVAYDAGDTVKTDNPATDKDVGSYFAMLDQDSYFPTWYNNEKTPREVASKSEAYNDTPTTTHMDSLGREIVIEVDNGPLGQSRDIRVTRTEYDIRGNVTELRDALDRVVTVTHYDLLGQPLHSVNMDSGSRWHLVDCCGSPILTWSGRGDQHRTLYDQLRRVQSVKIRRPSDSSELTVVKNIYGEGQPDALKNNLRGQLYECYDQSGRQTNDHFDFHGNCIESSVQYAIDYKNVLDWSKESTKLEKDTEYKTQSSFNAIGHLMHTEDFSNESVWRTYDIAGRLKTLESRAADGDTITSSVLNVEYSEDNKITLIEYGNGSRTSHEYDPITRRLVKTTTKCTKDSATLEALSLTYDCMGRIVHKADEAQQTVYFDNSVVSPSQEFRYDAIGQLLEATGREQVDITNGGQKRMRVYDATSGQRNPVPGDGRQMIEYIETYEYDVAGNIQKMKHEPRTATEYSGWTRAYSYDEPSCISSDARVKSNRLSSTAVRKVMETYQYNDDAGRNGCMTSIPGYSLLNWDHNDKLRAFSTQRVAEGSTPETTWYVYNAEGTRVRKVTERASINGTTPTRSKETRYLPMRDIYTTYGGDGFSASCQITTASVGDASLAERPIALLEHDASTKEQLIRYQTSMNLELDNNAQVLSYNEYSPFGASTYQALTKGVPRKYRFMGYQHDTESGLYICGERYYAPWLGRWTSPDPLGTDDGLNLYAYVKNDPVNFEDQQGTMRTEAENAALLEQRRAVRAPDTTHVTVPLNQIRWTQDSIGAEMGLPNIGPRQTHVAVEANTLAAQVASLQDTGLPLRAAQEQIAEEFLNGFGRIKVGLAAGQDQGGGPEQFAWYSVDNRRLTVLKTAMPDSDVPIRAEIADTAELNRATGTSVGQRQSEGFSELIDEGWRMRNSARVDDPDRVGVINKRIKKMWKDEGYFRFSKWTTVNDGSGIELRPPVIDGWEGGGRGGFRGGRGGGRGARGGRGGRGRGGGGRGGGRGGFNGGGRGGFNGGARGGFNGGGQGWPGGQGGFNRGRGGF